mgnify:CR=1 FL=1
MRDMRLHDLVVEMMYLTEPSAGGKRVRGRRGGLVAGPLISAVFQASQVVSPLSKGLFPQFPSVNYAVLKFL